MFLWSDQEVFKIKALDQSSSAQALCKREISYRSSPRPAISWNLDETTPHSGSDAPLAASHVPGAAHLSVEAGDGARVSVCAAAGGCWRSSGLPCAAAPLILPALRSAFSVCRTHFYPTKYTDSAPSTNSGISGAMPGSGAANTGKIELYLKDII